MTEHRKTDTTTSMMRRNFGLSCLLYLAVLAPLRGSTADSDNRTSPALLRDMIGTWAVEEWMWGSPGARAASLPAAVAERRLVGSDFVQEVMSTLPGSKDSFTRISYFGYNAVNHQYEYFSLDTRAPQMMNERSLGASGGASASGPVNLLGGDFVAPQWGTTKNAAFRYRIVVGPIKDNRQEVELYLTPLSAEPRPEFLAFKYVYTRHAEHG
jgi:hypothetical protein